MSSNGMPPVIFDDDGASLALDRVGALQAQGEGADHPVPIAQAVADELDAVIAYLLDGEETDLYPVIIDPIMQWAIYLWGQDKILRPESEGAQAYALISEFFTRHQHLNPEPD
jgi:hypothetical protein